MDVRLSLVFLIIALLRRGGAVLIETKEQCAAVVEASPTSSGSLTQTFYPPSMTTLTDFIATCMGSAELPVITENGKTYPSFNRFNGADCGSTIIQCCMVDPNPGELFCDFSRYARCDLFSSRKILSKSPATREF